jgi:drug/metabolite transporter (DMT)-like permease
MADRSLSLASDARRGILWMLLAMLVVAVMDTLNKSLAQTFPVPQIVWARFVFHMVLVTLVLGHRLPRVIVTRRLNLQVVRSLILICATILYVHGLSLLPLADVTAITFVSPILVTAFSAPLLGERVNRRQWLGMVLGFAGTLVIIRPDSEIMQLAALFPLGAAFFFALYQISTRQVSRTDPPMTTLFYTGLMGALVMSIAVPFFWVTPGTLGWLLLSMLGVCSGAVHYCIIKAFEAAPAATVAPFFYSTLIWATLSGFVFFDDLPDTWTVVGAAIVAYSGLYIARQERGGGGA